MVDVVAAYSNLSYPHKSAIVLRKLLAAAETSTREEPNRQPTPAWKLRQRLGSEGFKHIITDYQSGTPTTQLTEKYGISKTGILSVLKEAGVPMRRQSLTKEQVAQARELYESGKPLAAVARELDLAQESLRRTLVEAGVQMRVRGGSKTKRSPGPGL